MIKFLIVKIFLLFPSVLLAQNFLYEKKQIAEHKKTNSSSKFKTKEKLFGGKNKELGIKDIDIEVPAFIFSNYKLPRAAGTYDGLPSCRKSKTREIVRDESAFKSLDVVVYQFGKDDKKAKSFASAKSSKTQAVIPYIEGALDNPYRPSSDNAQTIIRGLGIECLPTKVKSVKINGKNGFKYFEGKLAWK